MRFLSSASTASTGTFSLALSKEGRRDKPVTLHPPACSPLPGGQWKRTPSFSSGVIGSDDVQKQLFFSQYGCWEVGVLSSQTEIFNASSMYNLSDIAQDRNSLPNTLCLYPLPFLIHTGYPWENQRTSLVARAFLATICQAHLFHRWRGDCHVTKGQQD